MKMELPMSAHKKMKVLQPLPKLLPKSNLLCLNPCFGMNQLPPGYFEDFNMLFSRILVIIMVLSSLLVLYQLIMGGFNWLTSGGDKGKIDQARSRIINAIVGIIIVAASYAIFTLVLSFLGTTPEALNSLIQ
jgi:hypothetical protein